MGITLFFPAAGRMGREFQLYIRPSEHRFMGRCRRIYFNFYGVLLTFCPNYDGVFMKKGLMICVAAFLALTACTTSKDVTKSGSAAAPYDFVILHYNDFHAHNTPWIPTNSNPDKIKVGGYAYLDAMMDSVEALYPTALRINAGDDFQGTPVSAITKGHSQFDLMNATGLDFFTIGNHEFDYGWPNIREALPTLKFPVSAANLLDAKTGKPVLETSRIFTVRGKKMGVFGLITPGLTRLTLQKNYEGLTVEDPVECARKMVQQFRDEGVEFIVAVTHEGVQEDEKLAADVPDLDLIIGSHSHTFIPVARVVGKTRIVQTGSYGRNLGIIKLTLHAGDIDAFNYQLEEVRPSRIAPSKDVEAIVDHYEAEVGKEMDEVIGVLKKDWTHRGLNSNLGTWQCEAMKEAVNADIAFQNNGGIRKDLNAGEIRVRDIWEIAPFGNTLVTFTLSGSRLDSMFQFLVSNNRFWGLQSAGFEMVVDSSSHSIKSLRVGGKAVDPRASYTVVTNNYWADNMEKNFGLKNVEKTDTGLIDRDIFVEKVRRDKFIDGNTEQRVRVE